MRVQKNIRKKKKRVRKYTYKPKVQRFRVNSDEFWNAYFEICRTESFKRNMNQEMYI